MGEEKCTCGLEFPEKQEVTEEDWETLRLDLVRLVAEMEAMANHRLLGGGEVGAAIRGILRLAMDTIRTVEMGEGQPKMLVILCQPLLMGGEKKNSLAMIGTGLPNGGGVDEMGALLQLANVLFQKGQEANSRAEREMAEGLTH